MDDARPVDSTEFRCVQCGYDVSGSAVGGTCPECGKPIGETLRANQRGDKSCGSATAAMVLGILSLTVCAILGPIAIFAATSARKDMAIGGYSGGSQTMAKAGLIMGVISTALFGLMFVVLILSAVFD